MAAVQGILCDSCRLTVHDMRTSEAQAKAKSLGIHRVPAVVIDGQLADCCSTGPVDIATLQRLGVGTP